LTGTATGATGTGGSGVTAIDPAEFLRALARELDDEAETAARACNCEGHYARHVFAADLAAVYRTRALNYESSTAPGASAESLADLISSLERLERVGGNIRAVGRFDMTAVLRATSTVMDAFGQYKASATRKREVRL
jgi:hypothetical protein